MKNSIAGNSLSGPSNYIAPVVNSFIGPCNTVAHVGKVPGISSTVTRERVLEGLVRLLTA